VVWTVACLAATAMVIAGGILVMNAGIRAGDQPGDATVAAAAGTVPAPDGPQRVVLATIRNPGQAPVLAGLTAYPSRLPGWLSAGMDVTVPHRTARRRYGPGTQQTVGVVGPGETACWPVPMPARGRTCHLVAVIGQSGARLRVIRLRVEPGPVPGAAPASGARTGPLSWLGDS
jgi:hypothetical protein